MPTPPQNHRALAGAAFCLASALAYTVVNVCMRQLAQLRCDPFWAVFNRELVTTVVVAPWLLWDVVRSRPALPPLPALGRLVLVGFLIQIVGNVCDQWALGVVGLVVTIPALYGTMILSGAAMGRAWLGEQVTRRSTIAMAVLFASLVLLAIGANRAGPSMAHPVASPPTSLVIALAVAAAGVAGATYSMLSITIRHSVTRTTSPVAVAFLVPLTGVIGLGPFCIGRLGLSALFATPWEQLGLMAAAGVFNLIGFLALIHGLKRTTVVHANVVGASQVAMAALAGVAIFAEDPNRWLLLGVGLAVIGILGIDRPADGGGL